jgi:starch synthase (maltosyl-transferring)
VPARHPDVIFLAEAFTRPKMMRVLAKAGFTQSYTYFTWRNDKRELIEYFEEITRPPMADYFRGHLWPNTPDILHETLQRGGPPAFRIRLVLAATLSSLYGIYSGYELCENTPFAAGSEEYLASEKYEIKTRDWSAPGNLTDLITRLNRIRRAHPALQRANNLRLHGSDDDHVLWYGKTEGDDVIFVAVNLDPSARHASTVDVPIEALGLAPDAPYRMRELLGEATYEWHGPRGHVDLDPAVTPAQIFWLTR